MPETCFGLRRDPFQDAPDLQFLYETPVWKQTQTAGMQFLQVNGGGLLLTAEAGLGKTLWGMVLLERLKASGFAKTAWMHRESVARTNLLRDVFHALKLEPPRHFTDPRAVAKLRHDLVEIQTDGRRAVLIVDGAEQLCPADLVRLGMLLQLAEHDRRLIDVVLLARPTPGGLLRSDSAATRMAVVSAQLELHPLTGDETANYLLHRLRVAGAEGDELLDESTCAAIHARCAGIPGKINRLAAMALIRASAESRARIDAELILSLSPGPAMPPAGTPPQASDSPRAVARPREDVDGDHVGSKYVDASGIAASRPSSAKSSESSRIVREHRAPANTILGGPTREIAYEQESPMSTHAVASAADVAAGNETEYRLESVLRNAEARAAAIEDRLARVGEAGDAAAERVDRLTEVCDRAARVEQRLALIAEQLADRIDHVQEQVTGLVHGVDAGESTRVELERCVAEGRRLQSDLQMQAQSALGDVNAQADRARLQLQEFAGSTIELAGRARSELESVRRELADQTAATQRATAAAAESNQQAAACRLALVEQMKQAEAVLARESAARGELITLAQNTADAVRRRIEDAARELASAAVESVRSRTDAAIEDALAQARQQYQKFAEDAQRRLRAEAAEVESAQHRAVSTLAALSDKVTSELHELCLGQRRQLEHAAEEGEQRLRQQGREQETATAALVAQTAQQCAATERQMTAAAGRLQSEWVQWVATQRIAVQKTREQFEGQIQQWNTTIEDKQQHMAKLQSEMAAGIQALDADAERSQVELQQSLRRLLDDANERRAMLESALRGDCDRVESIARANVASLAAMIEENVGTAQRMHEELADALSRRAESARRELAELDAYCYRIESVAGQVQAGLGEAEVSVGDMEQRLTRAGHAVEDIAARADASRGALCAAVDDAHHNLMRVGGCVAQLEALQSSAHQTLVELGSARERIQSCGEQLREADQLFTRLTSARDQAEAIDDALRTTADRAGRINQSLQTNAAVADDRLGRLSSHAAAANEIVHRISEATVAGHELREKLEETARTSQARVDQSANRVQACTERMEQMNAEGRQLCEKSETLAQQLRDMEVAATRAVEELRRNVEPAADVAQHLSRQVAEARDRSQGLQDALREAEELAARLDALTGMLRTAKELDTAVRSTVQQGSDTREALEAAIHDASRRTADLAEAGASIQHLLDTHERVRRDAQGVIAHLTDQLESARTASGSTARLLDEFLTQSRAVAEQLAELARRGSTLDQRVSDLLTRPEEIVAQARQQADQLEHVCSAVKKVFTGLSRATLEARKECQNADIKSREVARRIEELAAGTDVRGRQAAQHIEELTARTDQAVGTLREWVEEARRVQARLERAIDQSPSIRQTHPGESLEVLSRSAIRPVNASAFGDRYALTQATAAEAVGAVQGHVEPMDAPATGKVPSGKTIAAVTAARRDVPLGPAGMEDLTGEGTEFAEPASARPPKDADTRAAEIDAILADAKRAASKAGAEQT